MYREKFWENVPIDQLSKQEWEALCDGCGRCCLVKLEDEDTGQIATVRAHCQLFDNKSCRCKDYENRHEKVIDCLKISPSNIGELKWMPPSCAYRRIYEGRGLANWHPLISGRQETVGEAGISIKGQTICETKIDPEKWADLLDDAFDSSMKNSGS